MLPARRAAQAGGEIDRDSVNLRGLAHASRTAGHNHLHSHRRDTMDVNQRLSRKYATGDDGLITTCLLGAALEAMLNLLSVCLFNQ